MRGTRLAKSRDAFLAAFIPTASVKEAAKIAGIDRMAHYLWLQNDPEYAALFAEAREEATRRRRNAAEAITDGRQRARAERLVRRERKRSARRKGEDRGKATARVRDGEKCRICAFSTVVNVHHIIPAAEGGTHEPDNLITLCPNHHALADLGILTRQELTALIA